MKGSYHRWSQTVLSQRKKPSKSPGQRGTSTSSSPTKNQPKSRRPAALDVDDAPVVKFIQKMLLGRHQRWRIRHPLRAVRKRTTASDSVPMACCVKLRRHRSSSRKDRLPASRVISRLNIAESVFRRDGRMRLVLIEESGDSIFASALPTMYGEKIVLRILDPSSATLGIDALGYEPDQKPQMLDAIQRPTAWCW